MASNTEFTHVINELIGVDTPFQLFCIEHKITDHRKLKDRWKEIRTLKYTDSTGTKVKLSEEDINEFMAIVQFKIYLQNELGLKTKYPLNIKQYSREDFLCYYDEQFFMNLLPNKTSDNELWCNYFQHCSQYVEDYSLSSSEPSCDEINWPSSASPHGINCNNGFIDDDGILSHVPTPCGSSNIVTTNPNSKGGANFVEEKGVVETPASKNGINCNNGLGISTNGRGFDVDDEGILPHEPTSNPGEQSATTKAYPTNITPGSTNGINCSNDNNGESLSHAPPDRPPPIVNTNPNAKGADINGENGEITDSRTKCTQLNNNNDNNEYEHAERTQYRRIAPEDISTWARSSAQLYSRSENNSHKERTKDEWEAIALCAHLTDRVSKYVKNAISSYAVKDWQWLAKLVERLTHRGLLWYGVIVVVIMGVVMHDAHVGIENYVVRNIRSFSLNNSFDSSDMHGLIPSSWGRSSATRSTHFEYHSPEMNPSSSSSPYQYGESHPVGHNRFIPPMRHISTQGVRWRYTCEHTASVELVLLSSNYDTLPSQDEMDSFASQVDLSGVICPHSQSHNNQLTSHSANSEYENVLFDTSIDGSKTFEDEPRLWEDANPLITWNTSEIFANMKRLWGAIYHLGLPQTIVKSLLPTNYSHPANGPDTTFGTSSPSHVGAHLQTKLTENTLWHTNTSEAYSDMCRMDEQTLSSGYMTLVPNYYDGLTSHDVRFNLNLRVGNPTNTYQLTTYIQTRSLVQNNTEANYGNDMPNGECLNIPQDCMTRDIRRDSTRYDSMQQIFKESGENMIWAWPIVNTTTARMKGAQDYRSSRRDRTYNTMTTDDGELTNSYPENKPDGDVANIDEYLRRRGRILNRLLGIIGLTSARDTPVDTDIVSDPEPDESEILDEEGIRIYQSLIGAKWLVQLNRFDIAVLIMTLSSYWHSHVVATLIGELILIEQ